MLFNVVRAYLIGRLEGVSVVYFKWFDYIGLF